MSEMSKVRMKTGIFIGRGFRPEPSGRQSNSRLNRGEILTRALSVEMDHSFSQRFVSDNRLESIGNLCEVEPVSDPGIRRDPPTFDIRDHRTKIVRRRISTGEERQFAAMKIGIVEGDFPLTQAHKNNASTLSCHREGGLHRAATPCRIKDHGWKLPAQYIPKRLFTDSSLVWNEAELNIEAFLSEASSRVTKIDRADGVALERRKRQDAHSNGAGTEYRDPIIPSQSRPFDGVVADAEHFDESELIRTCPARSVEFVERENEFGAHPTIAVHPEDLQLVAAIAKAAARGIGAGSIQVGLHRDEISSLQICLALYFDNLCGKLVTQHSWVFKERLTPMERMDVGPTDADSSDSDPSGTGFQLPSVEIPSHKGSG